MEVGQLWMVGKVGYDCRLNQDWIKAYSVLVEYCVEGGCVVKVLDLCGKEEEMREKDKVSPPFCLFVMGLRLGW